MKKQDPHKALFVACILIGLGIGMLFNQTAPGVLIGIGIGFLLKWILRNKK